MTLGRAVFWHRRTLTAEQRRHVIEQYNAGIGGVTIARQLGVSEGIVYRTLRDAGVRCRARGRRPQATAAGSP